MSTSERFLLEAISDGGVLLDLDSGILFRLNRTAAFVWERSLAGAEPSDVASALARSFAVSVEQAQADVESALAPQPAQVFTQAEADFRYELRDGIYRFSFGAEPVLEVQQDGQSLRAPRRFGPQNLGMYLRALSPKLLALLGGSALHASAVMRPDGCVVAFLGAGGAGKTTTAQTFQRAAAWKVMSEDKLVLRSHGQGVFAVVDGEQQIGRWITSARERLQSVPPGTWCPTGDIDSATSGPVAPIAETILVDSSRRSGAVIHVRSLHPAAAVIEIIRHGFYGSPTPEAWRRQINVAATLARIAPTSEATMPNGLAELLLAAQRYTETTAS